MLTIKHCRRILGPTCTLTDEEIELLRDQLYAIADVAQDAYGGWRAEAPPVEPRRGVRTRVRELLQRRSRRDR